jgi:hypothetical protein
MRSLLNITGLVIAITSQSEFSLTQVLDRPLCGLVFLEEVIRENLDIGDPDQMQLMPNRRVTKRTPGRFRTRALTEWVTPSLHIDYKRSRIVAPISRSEPVSIVSTEPSQQS